jgi:DNA topoisomerase-2
MKDKDKDKESNNKRLSVERIYQRKSQLEHILLRPDTYIGSIEMETKVKIFDNFFTINK